MKNKNYPTIEQLQARFYYDDESGNIYDKKKRKNGLPKLCFNNINPGTGYYQGYASCVMLKAVAVFALVHGRYPVGRLRRIDGKRLNDRIGNLIERSAHDQA